MEEWRPVPGYEGMYEVSSLGRVRSLDREVVMRLPGKILTPQLNSGRSHLTVTLSTGGKPKVAYIHKLVALAFHGTPDEGLKVRHLNGEHVDNLPENLKYGTQLENMQDMVRHGKHWNQQKTHCPRGHLLIEPNLVKGEKGRSCRACGNARSHFRNHKRRGTPLPSDWDRKAYADARYQEIMKNLP